MGSHRLYIMVPPTRECLKLLAISNLQNIATVNVASTVNATHAGRGHRPIRNSSGTAAAAAMPLYPTPAYARVFRTIREYETTGFLINALL